MDRNKSHHDDKKAKKQNVPVTLNAGSNPVNTENSAPVESKKKHEKHHYN